MTKSEWQAKVNYHFTQIARNSNDLSIIVKNFHKPILTDPYTQQKLDEIRTQEQEAQEDKQ